VKVAQDAAGRFASRLLQSAGAEPDDADVVARALVDAERLGQGGHGLARLPGYVGRLQAGGTVSGGWQLVHAAGSVEAYDGRAGLGHVHLRRAVQRAAHLCEGDGLGLVGVANSNHGGALGVHARGLADAGLVSVLMTNGPAVIAPPGGREAVLGTNPIALAAPVPDGPPLVCDLATSQVSRGQIMRAAQEGRPIPPGWALDSEGTPTEDAPAALSGTLMPLGGPKGFALALAVEVLTGVLLGPAVGPEVADFFGESLDRPQGIAHLVLAIDPSAVGGRAGFDARMARLCAAVLDSGDGATRLPGSLAIARAAQHEATLDVGSGLLDQLERLADELAVERIVPL